MSTVTDEIIDKTITIKTARDIDSINQAAEAGFFPLIKPVSQCPKLRVTVTINQHKTTGEIQIDYSNEVGMGSSLFIGDDWQQVLEHEYYPINHSSPYAAYLIPKNLKPNTVVWLEDLIEDRVGQIHNGVAQGRLEDCLALWTGTDLELLDPVPMTSVG